MKAAIYARVSTLDQEPENQLAELRRFVTARGGALAAEHVDHGVSGAKERRPALDAMLAAAKRRRFDVLVVWKLDRLGRNLKPVCEPLAGAWDARSCACLITMCRGRRTNPSETLPHPSACRGRSFIAHARRSC